MDEHEPIALEYATQQSLTPPSESLRRTTVLLVKYTAGVGVGILLVYAISGVAGFAMMGFVWLYVGALCTFIAFVTGLVYAIVGYSRNFPPPSTRQRAFWAVMLPILNVVLAIACVAGGIALMSLRDPLRFD